MTLHIDLPPETERRLRERAAAIGKDVAALVVEAVEERLTATPDPTHPAHAMSPDEWRARLHDWINRFPQVNHAVDDSRETLYEGRDEA